MIVAALLQGCAQCLDSTRATPPSVQAAYRHAIELMASAGAALFASGTALALRSRAASVEATNKRDGDQGS